MQAVYDGVQARLYEVVMGQQVHVGGLVSTLELADAADVAAGQHGVELCCGSGATMRALVRLRGVAAMVGVEAATVPVERGRRAVEREGLSDRITFVNGDATATDLPDAGADFVWGEDAWCYVVDKRQLVLEAARVVRPAGVIAFTDWVEGPVGMSSGETDQVLQMMTFPNLQTVDGYRDLLVRCGCEVVLAEDTGRFAQSFRTYAEVSARPTRLRRP